MGRKSRKARNAPSKRPSQAGGSGGGPSSSGDSSEGGISSNARQDAAPTVKIDRSEPLSHAVGDRVEFPDLTSVGLPKGSAGGAGGGPHVGTVVGHWERREHWPERCRCPYLVLLDSGTTIYCPHTGDDFIRKSDVEMCKEYGIGSRVECRMGEDGRWFPGESFAGDVTGEGEVRRGCRSLSDLRAFPSPP